MEKLTKEGLTIGLVAEEIQPKAEKSKEPVKQEAKAEVPKAKAEKAKPVIKLS